MKEFVDRAKRIGMGDFELLDFTQDDILLFSSRFSELRSLLAEYRNSYERKQLSQEIQEKIEPMLTFLNLFAEKLKSKQNDFKYLDGSIRDGELAMRLLFKLANANSPSYSLKIFTLAEQVTQTTSRHGDTETFTATGTIWLLGDTNIIKPIRDTIYTSDEFKQILTDITKQGYPMVVCKHSTFCGEILPSDFPNLEKLYIPTRGLYNYIMGYLRDGPLKDAFTKLTAWTDKNGTDFSNLGEDELLPYIQNF